MQTSFCIKIIAPYLPPNSDALQSEFWTGLRNEDKVECKNGDCVNKLYWLSDGSLYDEHIPDHGLNMYGGAKCVRFNPTPGLAGFRDLDCGTERKFVCEFKCPEVAAPTITPNTCFFEHDVNYEGNGINNGIEDRKPDLQSCISFCKDKFPSAQYFSYMTSSTKCWCKTSDEGRRAVKHVISGKLTCSAQGEPQFMQINAVNAPRTWPYCLQ